MPMIEENKNDQKKFWNEINKILPGKNKTKADITLIDQDSHIQIEHTLVSSYINNYFAGIGTKLAKKLNEPWSFDGEVCSVEMEDFITNAGEIVELCKGLNLTKSSAIDGMSTMVIKDVFLAIPEQIAYLFNTSIDRRVVPNKWKIGTIVPLPKGGDKNNVTNLRPVSLLPLPGKLLEKVMHKRISKYLEVNNILSSFQGGYRKNHSMVQTIADFTDDILRERNVARFTLAIYIDLKKAFDTVDHTILVNKLERYGISDKTVKWMKDYLSNRKQRTLANWIMSSIENVTCGVPQGSILGPLMFLIYVNDVERSCSHSRVRLYADDTVLYASGTNIKTGVEHLQKDLNSYAEWCMKNKLTINVSKTKCMLFSSQKKLLKDVVLELDGEVLHKVSSYKYLGVTLDPLGNFELFVRNQLKTISYRIYQLSKLSHYLSKDALIKLYKSYILPIIDYGDVLYANTSVALLNKLQRAQNRCLKVCLKVNMRTPTEEIHGLTNTPILHYRRETHQKNFAYKRAQIDRYIDANHARTRNRDGPILKVFLPHTTSYQNSVEYSVGRIWNNLHPTIRLMTSLNSFKIKMKKELRSTIPFIRNNNN